VTPWRRITDGEVREPLRIVVTGGSVSLFVVPERTRRDEGNYGEVLADLLAAESIAATVDHQGKWFDMIHELRRRYEFGVRNRFPDVLILNYGMGEAQPHTLPTWLARHLGTWDRPTFAMARGYRRWVSPRLWLALRRWQQVSAQALGTRGWRLSPLRFRLEMTKVITMARAETGCLVLVIDCDPPGSRFEHWLPGMQQRWEIFQRALAELVDDLHDSQVRLVPASETLTDVDAQLPDGIHRTADAHRLTAELLREEIVRWLDEPADPTPPRIRLAGS
jgi:lysophospholipase L1-like esterase